MIQKFIICLLVLYGSEKIAGQKRCNECVYINSCPTANALQTSSDPAILNKFLDSFCGFGEVAGVKRPKICCSDFISPNEDPNENNIQSHRNLALLPGDCGILLIEGRIIGGKVAEMYEYPWMALLIFRSRGSVNTNYNCGGTIINSRYILTAAHCFDNPREVLMKVRVGEYNIKTDEDCDSEGCESHLQDLTVQRKIIHENYDKANMANDIALLRTKTPIDFGPRNVRPICLPVSEELRYMDLAGKSVSVAGWGIFTNTFKKNSDVLQKVEIPIWDEADCRNSVGESNFETLKILCAGVKGKDSCNGDSGGPLMAEEEYLYKNRMVQFGVVSNGPRQCGSEIPGRYTDVTKYIYWILENMEA